MYAETWGPAPDQARIKYSIEESYTGQYATMIRKFDTIDNSSDWYVDIDVNKCIFLDPLFYCIVRNDENNKKKQSLGGDPSFLFQNESWTLLG